MKNLYKDWTAESYEREISSLRQQLTEASQSMALGLDSQKYAIKEIEDLRQTCADQDKRWFDKHMEDEKEIESLRLAMNETGALLDKCQEEKGEWKRRATVVWESHRELGREVADWFEEKDDVND